MSLTYVQRTTPTTVNHTWRGICWAPGLNLFIVVGSIVTAGTTTGTSRVMASPDGNIWTEHDLDINAANTLVDVVWCSGFNLLVCCKISGTDRIVTSPDGTTWTSRPIPEANIWNAVAYSSALGIAVAVASSGTNRGMSSVNGTAWTARAIDASSWTDVEICSGFNAGAGRFIAVASTGSKAAFSDNGTTWTISTPFGTQSGAGTGCLAYSPTLNRAVCIMGGNDNPVWTTDDGSTWIQRTMPTTGANRPSWFGVTWDPGQNKFIAVARLGSTNSNQVAYSADGLSWTEEAPGVATVEPWRNAASNAAGLTVAIADNTTNDGLSAMTIAAGVALPTITGIVPPSGYTRGGGSVTITGTNFVNGLTVDFGGAPATSIVVTGGTTITCNYPAHAVGVVTMTVTNPDLSSTTTPFTYVAPVITSVLPLSGSQRGGTAVTITGDGFLAGSTITFDDVPATSVVFVDAQHYTCVSPKHKVGSVVVRITEPG